MTCTLEINKLKFYAEEILDIPFGSIDSKKRTRDVSLARMVVGAIIVCDLNINMGKAAELMKRDRTSFYFYKKKHKQYISDNRIYPEYNSLHELVLKKYMLDDNSLLKNGKSRIWFEQLEALKNVQKEIDRKMQHIEREAKLLGL